MTDTAQDLRPGIDQPSTEEETGLHGPTPLLEWVAAAIGGLLTLGLLGFIGWQALQGTGGEPAAVQVLAGQVTPFAGGFVVEVTARNLSPETAASVEVEGSIQQDGEALETATLSFDYVPGHSERRGGLFFRNDPAAHALEVRALGFEEP
jgi:uncharacterized protein (TIGR02588 family)